MGGLDYHIEQGTFMTIQQRGDNLSKAVSVDLASIATTRVSPDGVDLKTLYVALPPGRGADMVGADISRAQENGGIQSPTTEDAVRKLVHLLQTSAGYVSVAPPAEFSHETILRPPYEYLDRNRAVPNCKESLVLILGI